MRVLKEQEALGYLDRAQTLVAETRTSNDRTYPDLGLLKDMLQFQRAYLSTLLEDPAGAWEFAQVAISSSGFPELKSWVGDIRRGKLAYESTLRDRAKTLIPLVDQVAAGNASALSIEDITSQLRRDNILSSVFGVSQSESTSKLLKQIMGQDSKVPHSLSVAEDPSIPGFIKVKYDDYTIDGNNYKSKYFASAVKYIDDSENPILLRYVDEDRFRVGAYKLKEFPEARVHTKGDYRPYVDILRGSLEKYLVTGDFTGSGVPGFAEAFSELEHFNNMLNDLRSLLRSPLEGRSLNPAEYPAQLEHKYQELQEAMARASSPVVEALFKESLAFDLASLKENAQDLSVGAKGRMVAKYDRSSRVGRLWRAMRGWQ